MTRRRGPTPPSDARVPIVGWICTMQVRDLDTILHAVINAGGSVIKARHAIPGIGWYAYVRDTEGNIFGLTEADAAAA
jgi:predicted enzyme related to lactoylglutathione lyase